MSGKRQCLFATSRAEDTERLESGGRTGLQLIMQKAAAMLWAHDLRGALASCRALRSTLPQAVWFLRFLRLNTHTTEAAVISTTQQFRLVKSITLCTLVRRPFHLTNSAAAALLTQYLTSLNLDGNCIGEAGAQALAAALRDSKLTSLKLRWNHIGDAGARALATALRDSNLTSLDLYLNHIGDAAAQALAAAATALEHAQASGRRERLRLGGIE